MPTRNISLTPEQDAFIEEAVKSGEYQNASEAIRDALRALQQRRREDALKLEVLRQQIDAGIAALERGEFIDVDDAALDAYLDGSAARADEPAP
jgi:antitoxin ParD1/3/4